MSSCNTTRAKPDKRSSSSPSLLRWIVRDGTPDYGLSLRWLLAGCGWLAAATYGGWNAAYLCAGQIPPSMLTRLTGIPSPTTGGTRAWLLLWEGDWGESLRAHPLAIPITALFVATLLALTLAWKRTQKLRLHRRWWAAWAVLLIVAWIVKLLGPVAYW